MASADYLLTIAIPTYNRSKYLDRALNYIYLQLRDQNYSIELIVSDNCSTDNTFEIVSTYINKGLPIRYIKNVVNKGSDFNIAQCYLEAKGKYIVALGDDDILLPGAVEKIISIISNREVGVVFLESQVLTKSILNDCDDRDLQFTEFHDSLLFVRKVNYSVTFISSNVINAKYLNKDRLLKYQGTSVIQVSFIMDAILNSDSNIYIQEGLLAAEPDNSGGYSLFKVFGENLFSILNNYDKQVKEIIENRLILDFFPYWILHLRINNSGFNKEDPLVSLKKVFGSNFYFKIFIYPLAVLPLVFAKIQYRIITRYDKIYTKYK